MKKLVSFFAIPKLLFVTIGLIGCGPADRTTSIDLLSWTDTVKTTIEHPAISIANQTDSEIRFKLKLNHRFPLSVEEMKAEISAAALTDSTSVTIAAWQFVADNTYHLGESYSDRPWVHDPFIAVNSLAGGLCDDRSSVLALLWQELGYNGRVVHLTGHVVSEVNENGVWKLYDSDNGVYYKDGNDNIVGVGRIEKNGLKDLRSIGADPTRELLTECGTPDSKNLTRQYMTVDDNDNGATDWCLNFNPVKNDVFILPPGAELLFVKGKGKQPLMAVVRLTEKSTGILRIPLVPYALKGNAIISTKEHELVTKTDTLLLFSNDAFHDSLTIHQVKDQVDIFYHINPKICRIFESNSIGISNATGKLHITASSEIVPVYDNYWATSMFINNAVADHLEFLRYLSVIKETDDAMDLKKLYEQFLLLDSHLNVEQQTRLQHNFKHDLKLVRDTLHMKEAMFLEQVNLRYPRSVLWIFMAMRYDSYRYLQKFVLSDPDVLKEE